MYFYSRIPINVSIWCFHKVPTEMNCEQWTLNGVIFVVDGSDTFCDWLMRHAENVSMDGELL